MDSLNFDILVCIITHLPPSDALSISTICKAIHAIVVRNVLSAGIDLRTPKHISQFPNFLFADSYRRLPHLRELRVIGSEEYLLSPFFDCERPIGTDSVDKLRKFAEFLVEILTRSNRLRVLALCFADVFVKYYDQLRESLITYDGLVELTLYDVDQDVLQVVKDMRSNLRVLSFHDFGWIHGLTMPFLQYIAPQQQLQTLNLHTALTDLAVWDYAVPHQWHAMRDLEVTGEVPMETLVAAFPNLHSLRTVTLKPGGPAVLQWNGLEHLYGEYNELYLWRIQCPVRWLELSCIVENSFHFDWDGHRPITMLTELLHRTQPMILTFSVRYNTDRVFWKQFALSVRDVKLVELTVCLPSKEDDEDDEDAESEKDEMDDEMDETDEMDKEKEDEGFDSFPAPLVKWMKAALQYLSGLPVPCLCVSLQFMRGTLEKEDATNIMQGIRQALINRLPHLQYLAITIDSNFERYTSNGSYSFERGEERMCWQICRHENGGGIRAIAQLIPQWKGERITGKLHGMDYKSLLLLKPHQIELY